jgi:hypothetical protein
MIPLKDSLLVPYSTNFNDRIVASPTTWHLTSIQAAAYTALHSPYISAYNTMMAARADGTQSQSLTAAKDSAKLGLLNYARELYSFVAADNTISQADKILLGIHLRVIPGPIPRPGVRPGMDIISVNGRTVALNIHDSASSSRRGKPAGSLAAWVYSYVGENYPADMTEWNFEGATTKPRFDILFPSTVAGGSQVWVCAAWINAKQELGPMGVPQTTNLQGGGESALPSVRIAA